MPDTHSKASTPCLNRENISSMLLGARFKPLQVSVDARMLTNYAAVIGARERIFYDDTGDKQIAPALFPVVLSWPLLSNLAAYADFDLDPTLAFAMVHYSEMILYQRPLQPRQSVCINTHVAGVQAHRSGTVLTLALDATVGSQPVYTEYIQALLRGVVCQDQGAVETAVPVLQAPAIEAALWQEEVFFDELLPYLYDGCSNIVFGIHTSPNMAKNLGLPGIIVQGTALLGIAVQQVLAREGITSPNTVRVVGGQFRAMVLPGQSCQLQLLQRDTLDAGGTVLHFELLAPGGRRAIQAGRIELNSTGT